MCNLGDAIEKRGIAIGRALAKEEARKESVEEGIREGRFITAVMYYRKGRITAEEAASDLNMPLSEFLDKVKESK